MHTTSSDSAPFAIISDTLINRHLAMRLGVPVILGLEESLDGTILNYINELGYAAVGFEAGQHQAPSSVENHEAAIWLLFWLKVSAWMRHRKLDRILLWLPGVNPLPDDQSALVIDIRVARWFVIEICHLLGFRKHSQEEGRLIVRRRRQSPEHRNGTV